MFLILQAYFFLYLNFRGSYKKTIVGSGFKKHFLTGYVACMHTNVIFKYFCHI